MTAFRKHIQNIIVGQIELVEADAPAAPSPIPNNTDPAPTKPESLQPQHAAPVPPNPQMSAADADLAKVKSLYSDTGDPGFDYSLTNDGNRRLFKFKFNQIGVDTESLMTESEKGTGVPANQLVYRLSPDQIDDFFVKSHTLREKYELIKARERNIAIYNARIAMFHMHEGKLTRIDDDIDEPTYMNAQEKVNQFMVEHFGEDWVDSKQALTLLQNIKINFDEVPAIKANLANKKLFSENSFRSFYQIRSPLPKSLESFVKENKENQEYKKSSFFRTLSNYYDVTGTDSVQLFPLMTAESGNAANLQAAADTEDQANDKEEKPATDDEAAPEGDSEDNPESAEDKGASPNGDSELDADIEKELGA